MHLSRLPLQGNCSHWSRLDQTFLICSVCQKRNERGLDANSLFLATHNVQQELKKTVAMDEQQSFSSRATKALGNWLNFRARPPLPERAGLDLGQPPSSPPPKKKLAESLTYNASLSTLELCARRIRGRNVSVLNSLFVYCWMEGAFLEPTPRVPDIGIKAARDKQR